MPRLVFALIAMMACLLPLHAQAAQPVINDADALKGQTHAKGVFLIDFTDPAKTAFYLEVIKGTHAGFVRQKVKPDLVLVFIGPTVRFLTTEPHPDLAFEQGEHLEAIARHVRDLKALGVRMEACAVATEVFGVRNETILPEIKIIGDGFISLIGYQGQGYKLVPLF